MRRILIFVSETGNGKRVDYGETAALPGMTADD